MTVFHQPTNAAELRAKLSGAWKLERYVYLSIPPSTTKPFHPMTPRVQGMIMYTTEGYMSAQMSIPGQSSSFDVAKASEAEWAECAKRYFGYAGPYHVTEEDGKLVLKHEFRVSYRPDLAGDIQVRGWKFENDGQLLILGGEEPTTIKGELRTPELRWRRLENNA